MIGIGNDTNIIIKLGTSDVEIYLGSEKVYPNTHDYSLDYFTIEALGNGYIYMDNNINSYEIALNDSLDVWNSTTFPDTNQIYLTTGDKLHIRCQGTPKVSVLIDSNSQTYNGIGTFNTTFRFKAYGNIMSLLYGGNFAGQTTFPSIDLYKTNDGTLVTQNYNRQYFLKFFINNTNLVDAGNLVLPATTLASDCYNNMFKGCSSLVNAPSVLPATTLTERCYWYMFDGCTSLTSAPELPATTLANSCYAYMFNSCTNLTVAPELPATTLANNCYNSMFYGCTSLTAAPELPATTLTVNCYRNMFNGCSSLNYIKAMFTTTPSGGSPNYYTQNWVSGVAATGTFVKNSAATWDVSGVNGIPTGWTVQTASE